MPEHIVFSCGCGRDLRAKADLAGTTVRCWSCHAEVPVPRAKAGGGVQVAWLLAGVRDLFSAEVILSLLLGGLVVACALAIPVVGGVVGFALLAAAAVVYREIIRISGLQGATVPREPAWRDWPVRYAWGLAIALGLAAPALLRHMVMDAYGWLVPLQGVGVAVAVVLAWFAVPLIALIGSACDRSGPLTVRRALAVVGRHPYATFAGLLIVPLGLAVVEVAVMAITAQQDWFGFMVLDLFPGKKYDRVIPEVIPPYDIVFPEHASFPDFLAHYSRGLRRGYTLIGALPSSLPRFPDKRIWMWFPLTYVWMYLAVRILYSTLILAASAFLLAIQARWLGLIPTLDARRTAAPVRPNPVDAPLGGGV